MSENLTIVIHNLVFIDNVDRRGGFFSNPAFYIKIQFGGEEYKTKTTYDNPTDPKFDLTIDLGAAD